MMTRRMLLGSTAAAGVGAIGVATFNLPAPAAAQTAAGNAPLANEIQRQLRDGMQKLLGSDRGNGARQLATSLRFYAATQNDDQLRAALRETMRQKGRSALILAPPIDHAEMQRMGRALGIPANLLPAHGAPNQIAADAALNQLLTEGLTAHMRRAADTLDQVAALLDKARGGVRTVAFQGPGSCDGICASAENADDLAKVLCAVAAGAALFPVAREAAVSGCAAAVSTWLVLNAGCNLCKIAIATWLSW
jgi:hypothetical protein